MALVNDKIIVPTKVPCSSIIAFSLSIILSKDAPELAYIVESSEAQYIPDVFFMQKDEYGNEIKKIGRPLPVEYLLIDVPVTTPLQVALFTHAVERRAINIYNEGNSIMKFAHF